MATSLRTPFASISTASKENIEPAPARSPLDGVNKVAAEYRTPSRRNGATMASLLAHDAASVPQQPALPMRPTTAMASLLAHMPEEGQRKGAEKMRTASSDDLVARIQALQGCDQTDADSTASKGSSKAANLYEEHAELKWHMRREAAEKEALTAQLALSDRAATEFKEEIASLKQRVSDLSFDLKKATSERDEARRACDAERSVRNKLELDCQGKEREIARLKVALSEVGNVAPPLEAAIADLRGKLEASSAREKSARLHYEQLLEGERAERVRLEEALKATEAAAKRTLADVASSEKIITELKTRLNAAESARHRRSVGLHEAEGTQAKMANAMQHTIDALNAELVGLREELRVKEVALLRKGERCAYLEREMQSAVDAAVHAEMVAREAEAAVPDLRRQLERESVEKDKLTKELAAERRRAERAESTLLIEHRLRMQQMGGVREGGRVQNVAVDDEQDEY